MRREKSIFVSCYNERCKTYRRLMQQSFNPASSQGYWNIQEDAGRQTIDKILQNPEKLIEHLRWNAASVTLKIAYGYTIADEDDHFISIAEEASRVIASSTAPGKWLVDSVPILRFLPDWFPGARFKKRAKLWSKHLYEMSLEPHLWVKDQIKNGLAYPSFTSELLQDPNGDIKDDAELDDLVLWTAAALYQAGTDTTVSAMRNFFFCMMMYPEVQNRAQQEVDRFMNEENRLPALQDWSRGALPYMTCIVQEVLRWHTAAPMAIPHATAHEDVYGGHYIPAKVTIIGNVWAMLHDESVYPRPDVFDPDRYSGKDGRKIEDDPRQIAFGFGRRICPGRYIAEASIWIQIALALACLQIDKPLGEEPEAAFTSGLLSHLKPFPYKINQRNSKATEWMRQAMRSGE
ncbi:hypothetical protein V5O48_016273 [Marasmius crinis-equi]|uniref:Cytochrome P450 n=1 Tax=Marasmius crinis-equi TaxID=585013 RepID=A0ABR3ESH1_9AGAR